MSAATVALRRAALEAEARALSELERRAVAGEARLAGGRALPRGRALEAFLFRYMPHAFRSAPGEFHRELYALAEAMVHEEPIDGAVRTEIAIAAPRSFAKSTTMTLGFAAWVIYNWRSLPFFDAPPFILIVSDSADQARDRCLDLREEVEGNEALLEDYGPRAPRAEDLGKAKRGADGRFVSRVKWTESDWTTRDGVRVRAVGSGTRVRGMLRRGRRPTLVIVDDLENDEAVETIEQRRKLNKWFARALLPVGLQGQCLYMVLGTLLHADSLLAKLIGPSHYPDFAKRRYAACTTEDGTPAAPAPHGPATRTLWADWSIARLAARWRAVGSLAFSQEYLNQPIDDENSPFKREWLEAALKAGTGVPFWYDPPQVLPITDVLEAWDLRGHPLAATHYQVVITAWDLALVDTEDAARTRDSDYTVGVSLGLTCDEHVEVRRLFRKRGMTPNELRGRIVIEQGILDALYVVIENVAAQRFVELDLREILGGRVVGHQTDRAKRSLFDGVPAMALLFETLRIRLCHASPAERARLEVLIQELHGLGVEAHDDTVMALWMALRVLSRWQRRRNQERAATIGDRPAHLMASGIFPERVEETRDAAATGTG